MTSLVVIQVSKQSSKFRDYITCREVEGFIELSWRVMANATTDSKYNKCNFINTYFYVSDKNLRISNYTTSPTLSHQKVTTL